MSWRTEITGIVYKLTASSANTVPVFPCYDKERQSFHLHGELRDILGGDKPLFSNFVMFLHGIEVNKSI
jgi:hypothetical protein